MRVCWYNGGLYMRPESKDDTESLHAFTKLLDTPLSVGDGLAGTGRVHGSSHESVGVDNWVDSVPVGGVEAVDK